MNFVVEKNPPSYTDSIFKISGNIYLDGFWQFEDYFKEIESLIRKEFQFKNQPDNTTQGILKEIKNKKFCSVGIHIRRGDYANNRKTFEFHGLCSKEYFYSSINIINSKVDLPYYFIFTDDVDWVKSNIKIGDNMKLVSCLTKNEIQDLFLLSNCKHFIISNSSFSWWGAWLSSNDKKIVVAPKKWFRDRSANSRFFLPENWIKI